MKRPEFLVYAPTYSEVSGGVLAAHALCARLNAMGYAAAIWPWDMPSFDRRSGGIRRLVRYVMRREWRWFDKGPFNNPLAWPTDIKSTVMVYPEVVAGNPLGARKVVRWLLHKPGYHNGVIEFGPDDIFFYYDVAFNDPGLNPHSERLLRLTYVHPAYRQTNFGERQGACVLFRKGKGRPRDQHPKDAIVIDDMTHEQMSAVFNRCEFLYCYDLYTFYTVYAVICGCTPIVIPQPGLSREAWHPEEDGGLALAYGVEEISRARHERPLLITQLERARAEEDEMVRRFARICRKHWS